jgi:ribosome maturation factor RimP
MADALKDKVIGLIQGPLEAEGFEIADMALSRYRTEVTLRVFVYGTKGPDLATCARLSHLIGEVIDGTDLFENGYALEVSSPGLDRPLTTPRDFKYRVGETVRIEFTDPKRKKQTATIIAVTGDSVEFKDDTDSFTVPLAEIGRAKIVF